MRTNPRHPDSPVRLDRRQQRILTQPPRRRSLRDTWCSGQQSFCPPSPNIRKSKNTSGPDSPTIPNVPPVVAVSFNRRKLVNKRTSKQVATSFFSSKPHADVLRRVFDLPGHGMTPALAEGILALDFPDSDAARIAELNLRANEGQLTDEERSELEACINISDLLAWWQSKARQTIQSRA
jgi:hypothetical protein